MRIEGIGNFGNAFIADNETRRATVHINDAGEMIGCNHNSDRRARLVTPGNCGFRECDNARTSQAPPPGSGITEAPTMYFDWFFNRFYLRLIGRGGSIRFGTVGMGAVNNVLPLSRRKLL